jgi:protoporphyrinogen oxidase
MRVAVIGAGVTGLVAAYRLTGRGHVCDVYERWPGLGGQVATLDVGDGHLLERYYHHLFTSDRYIAELYDELGMENAIEWHPSTVAMFADGRSHPFTTPLDLLRFTPLGLGSRIRMGLAVVWLQRRHRKVGPLEDLTAREWIQRAMGREAYEKVWGPLLRGKFGDRADDISMAWLWSKLTLRRQIRGKEARQELLGYPVGGWQPLLDRLRDEIESRGGRVLIDRPAAEIGRADSGYRIVAGAAESFRRGHDPRRFERSGAGHYDAVLATVPNDIFCDLLDVEIRDELGSGYVDRLQSIEYHSALCMLIELDRRFSPFYWTNIADRDLPFVGLIEQTNFVGSERYGGRRFLYVANYVSRQDPILQRSPEELLERYEPGLRMINQAFSRDWVRRLWTFHEPAAQPVVTVGYRQRIPPLETGAPGLVLANTTQIYPEDRGTNYSVRLGTQAADVLSRSTAEHGG